MRELKNIVTTLESQVKSLKHRLILVQFLVILLISAVLYPETVWILRPAVLGVVILIALFFLIILIKAFYVVYKIHKESPEKFYEGPDLDRDALTEIEGNK